MDDTQRAAELRRMQRIATGLLIGATLLFFVSSYYRDLSPVIPFIKAFAEASMIGALADWFAVTALFRHPLGIPIPHTAIIPARKDRIAESFGRFIERNFLDPDKIAERIRRQDPASRLAQWLRQPERSIEIADFAGESLAGMLKVANDEDVGRMIERGLADRIDHLPAAPLIGKMLGAVIAEQRQYDMLYETIRLATLWVESNEETIRKRIAGELPPWMPRIVDRKIYERLLEGTHRTLRELSDNPDHPLYSEFTQALDSWIVNLQYDPEVIQRGEEIKAELLEHPMLRELASSVWQDMKVSMTSQITMRDSPLRHSMAEGLSNLGDVLENNAEWRAKIDGWTEDIARYIVSNYGRTVGEFVTNTVKSWDTNDTSRKIELQFGRDLQFIRINGTIVGGLAGLVIYTISLFL